MIVSQKGSVVDLNTHTREGRLSKGELTMVLALTLAALAIRLLMLRHPADISSDGVWYSILGKNLISGNFKEGLSTYWPPLYPLLVGLLSVVTADLELAGRLVSVLSGGFLVIPQYLLVRRLYGMTTASVAALLTAVYPSLLQYSGAVLTESLYTLLFTLAMLSGLSALFGGRTYKFFLTGVAIGSCYLVKPEAVGFAGLMTVMAAGSKLFRDRATLKTASVSALLFAAGFLLLSLPYMLYLRAETGRWGISEKLTAAVSPRVGNKDKWRGLINGGQTTLADRLWAGSRAQASATDSPLTQNSTQGDASGSGGGWSLVRMLRPGSVSRNLYAGYLSLPKLMSPALIFLAGLGFLGGGWTRERAWREAYLLSFAGSTLAGYAVMGFETRYGISLLPILITWSSKGLLELEVHLCDAEEQVRRSAGFLRQHRLLLRSLVLLCLTISLLPWILSVTRPGNGDEGEKRLALAIKGQSAARPVVMATSPRMAFFTGGKHLYIPDEDYRVVIDYALRKKVDYLVADERSIYLTPKLQFLLDDLTSHPEVQLVTKDDTPQNRIRIFRLTRPLDVEKRLETHSTP